MGFSLCPGCGRLADTTRSFCTACGCALKPEECPVSVCPHCGRAADVDRFFCTFCSRPLTAKSPPLPRWAWKFVGCLALLVALLIVLPLLRRPKPTPEPPPRPAPAPFVLDDDPPPDDHRFRKSDADLFDDYRPPNLVKSAAIGRPDRRGDDTDTVLEVIFEDPPHRDFKLRKEPEEWAHLLIYREREAWRSWFGFVPSETFQKRAAELRDSAGRLPEGTNQSEFGQEFALFHHGFAQNDGATGTILRACALYRDRFVIEYEHRKTYMLIQAREYGKIAPLVVDYKPEWRAIRTRAEGLIDTRFPR